jgi:hypothetical protein
MSSLEAVDFSFVGIPVYQEGDGQAAFTEGSNLVLIVVGRCGVVSRFRVPRHGPVIAKETDRGKFVDAFGADVGNVARAIALIPYIEVGHILLVDAG